MATHDDAFQVRSAHAVALQNGRTKLARHEDDAQQAAITAAHAVQLQALHSVTHGFMQGVADYSEQLLRVAAGAAEAVANISNVADRVAQDAAASTDAFATTANNIKAMARAVDDYLQQLGGLNALLTNEAAPSRLSKMVTDVSERARKIAADVDDLRGRALRASVLEAKVRAGAAQQSAKDTGQKVSELAARAQRAFQDVAENRDKRLEQSTAASVKASAALEKFVLGELRVRASHTTVETLSRIANENLIVVQMPMRDVIEELVRLIPEQRVHATSTPAVPDGDPDLTIEEALSAYGELGPGFRARIDPMPGIENVGHYYFLVPAKQSTTFDAATAKFVIESGASNLPRWAFAWSGEAANLLTTIDGKLLKPGEVRDGYVVIALQVVGPHCQEPPTPNDYSDANLSLASDVMVPIRRTSAPRITATSRGADAANKQPATLSVAVEPPELPPHCSMTIRCHLVRWDVCHALLGGWPVQHATQHRLADIINRQPIIDARFERNFSPELNQKDNAHEGLVQFDFCDGDLDAFGDVLWPSVKYLAIAIVHTESVQPLPGHGASVVRAVLDMPSELAWVMHPFAMNLELVH